MQSSYSSYPSFFQARRGASTKKRNQRGSSPLLQRPTPDRRLGIQSPYRRRYLIPADGRNTTFGGSESAQVAEKADPCPMEARYGLVTSTFHRFARHRSVQGVVQVVVRDLQARRVGGGLVVDGSLVDELAGGIDDEDVRRGARVVQTPNGAGGVHQRGAGRGMHRPQVLGA